MTIYKEAVLDIKTGNETFIEFTAKEFREANKQQDTQEAKQAAQQAEQAAKEAARQSALDKLSALGLSPEEIAAITGGN